MKNTLKNMTTSDKAFYGTLGALGTATAGARYLANKNYPEGIGGAIKNSLQDTTNKMLNDATFDLNKINDSIRKEADYIQRVENPVSRAILDAKPDFDTNTGYLQSNNINPMNYQLNTDIFESSVHHKIDLLIEEAATQGILQELDGLLKDKWDWKLTPEIKEKFESRFSKIKKDSNGYEAFDNKKKRPVYLRPNNKSLVLVKDTGNWCGFLRGAVQASKNKASKD